MRSLAKNKQRVFYSLFLAEKNILDEYGYETGETEQIYTSPTELFINQGPATGEAVTHAFGDLKNYSKVLCTTDTLPLKEGSRLWIDNLDVTKPFDYVVKKVARSLNGTLYAIGTVTVDE